MWNREPPPLFQRRERENDDEHYRINQGHEHHRMTHVMRILDPLRVVSGLIAVAMHHALRKDPPKRAHERRDETHDETKHIKLGVALHRHHLPDDDQRHHAAQEPRRPFKPK